jgi:NADPH:quinone reductase-like Zn-dependent oxidoreductase
MRGSKCSPLLDRKLFQSLYPDKCHRYPLPVTDRGIEGSCCAAEVVAIGNAVGTFTIGDHVTPTTNLNLLTGDERDAGFRALGGDVPGVLRQYAVFEEKHLVLLPSHLSWEEVHS